MHETPNSEMRELTNDEIATIAGAGLIAAATGHTLGGLFLEAASIGAAAAKATKPEPIHFV
jgi:hypothetical protein